MKEDLTTGSIYRKLYIFALPLVFTNLLQMSMQLTDSLWVGNLLGSTAFGAITIGLTVMSIVLAFVLGSNNAILTIFAQLSGKNDPKEIKSLFKFFGYFVNGSYVHCCTRWFVRG